MRTELTFELSPTAKNAHHPPLIKWNGEKGNQIDVVIINFYGASPWRKSLKRLAT